jgi:hypothetical protein
MSKETGGKEPAVFPADPYGEKEGEIAGSHPVLFRRRRDDDGGPGPDDDPPPPPPPPPSISAPDLAMQFRPCLKDIPTGEGVDLEAAVIAAVRGSVGPEADVRYNCLDGTGRIGVWLRPATPAADQARDRGIAVFNMLGDGEQFAMFINAAFVKRTANTAWDTAPKRTDHEGNAQEDGSVHLTGFDVEFVRPDRIVTTISGFDETPLPDVTFDLIITDTLRATGGAIQLESTTDLKADRSGIHIIAGVFFLASRLVHPLFAVIAAGFVVESLIIGSQDPDDDSAGAGALVAAQIPKEVFIDGGDKLVPLYDRVTVTSAGLVAAGVVDVVARDPIVSIVGPRRITVSEGAKSVTKSYHANAVDLRNPIAYSWSGGGRPTNPRRRATAIRFDLDGLALGESVSREVRLTATDTDDLTAQATVFARIFMTNPDDDTRPPICKTRPWLPQCQPEEA